MNELVPVLALGVAALGVVVPPIFQLLTARSAAREAERARLFEYKRDVYLRVLRCISEFRSLGAGAFDIGLRDDQTYAQLQALHGELKAAVAELEIYAVPDAARAASEAVAVFDDALYNNSHSRRDASPEHIAGLLTGAQDTGQRFVEAARHDLGVRSGSLKR